MFSPVLSRRTILTALAASLGSGFLPRRARAFGQSGAFRVRRAWFGSQAPDAARDTASSRWAWELMQRTSAPARLDGCSISAESAQLFDEPFAIWTGSEDPGVLANSKRRAIDRFLRLGGLLVVDDSNPATGAFGRGARRELTAIAPDSPIQTLPSQHVLYKSFYLLSRPVGRYVGSGKIDAISRGRYAQVLFLDCDLLGALAMQTAGDWTFDIVGGGTRQREDAIRLAVNLAMFLLCSDYKDDQVHAAWLMRHRLQIRK
jgi:hypothetical protein